MSVDGVFALQLDPPPSEPLYVVGVRSVLLYLREMSEIEDLGLDEEGGGRVITILSDALNCRDVRLYTPRLSHSEPWLDVEQCV